MNRNVGFDMYYHKVSKGQQPDRIEGYRWATKEEFK
jgi:hypothetical protein